MRRRDFLAGLAALAAPKPARTQSAGRLPVVGFVGFASAAVDARTIDPFRAAMRELGQVEGRSYMLDARSADGDVTRGHAMIDALAALPASVFLSPGPAATRAILRKTRIPVVAIALPATESEPELFRSLARPGGTVTGFSAYGEELSAKRIQMLKEALPDLKVLGVLHNATDPTYRDWGEQTMADARRLGIEPVRLGLSQPSATALRKHLQALGAAGGTAVIVIRDFMTSTLREDICQTGAAQRIAVIGENSDIARAGALFSYGADLGDLFRRAASYVDRILKGEKPGDLPIQLPTKFELVVNLRTARALGMTLPEAMLARADELVE